MHFLVGQRFYAWRRRTWHATKIRSFCGRRGRRKAPSRTEVTLGGALPPARGDLDDFVTSPMHDGTRWAVPRTAGRAVVGLGVARRPAWVGHAAPIVTRGRHVFTEAGRVHGSWRAPRGDDSRPRSPPSLVSGTPPPSIPCGVSSGLTRPSLSRRCASFASRRVHVGPVATLRQCVCVNMPNLFSYILPLNLQNHAAKGRRRFASLAPARAGVVCGAWVCAFCK